MQKIPDADSLLALIGQLRNRFPTHPDPGFTISPDAVQSFLTSGGHPSLPRGPMNLGVPNLANAMPLPSKPVIPRANANGMTRVSPGVYRNAQGSLVQSMNGA